MQSIQSFVFERLKLNLDSKIKKDDIWYFVVPGYSHDDKTFIELKKTYSKSYINGSKITKMAFYLIKKNMNILNLI